jgi:hypothetical protein
MRTKMIFLATNSRKFSEKARKRWKIFYSQSSLFIGAKGVVQESCLDMTVASFPEDTCPLRRSEGDVFLPEFKSFRGNGSSESTRFPDGLVLGNSVKALHPWNIGLAEIRKAHVGWKVQFGSYGMFYRFKNKCAKVTAELGLCARTFNPFQDVCGLRNSGIKNPQNSGIMNLWSSRIMYLWNSGIGNLRNSGIYWSLN